MEIDIIKNKKTAHNARFGASGGEARRNGSANLKVLRPA